MLWLTGQTIELIDAKQKKKQFNFALICNVYMPLTKVQQTN